MGLAEDLEEELLTFNVAGPVFEIIRALDKLKVDGIRAVNNDSLAKINKGCNNEAMEKWGISWGCALLDLKAMLDGGRAKGYVPAKKE